MASISPDDEQYNLRQREEGLKVGETPEVAQDGKITSSSNSKKRTGRRKRLGTPPSVSVQVKQNPKKRKANYNDQGLHETDSQREAKRKYSADSLPPTPMSEKHKVGESSNLRTPPKTS